jgi:hypothetical protein
VIDLGAAMGEAAAALQAGGVPTWVDPRDVNVPGCWVHLLTAAADVMHADCATLRLRVCLIVPDVGTTDALDLLSVLYADALAVYRPNTGTPAATRTFLLPDSATAYPGLFYDVDLQATTAPPPAPPAA